MLFLDFEINYFKKLGEVFGNNILIRQGLGTGNNRHVDKKTRLQTLREEGISSD